jgi:hypothetical protein
LQVIDRVNSIAKRVVRIRNSKSFECPECHFDQPSLGESTLRVQPPQGSIAAACSSHWPKSCQRGRFFLRTTDLCDAEPGPMVDAARCRNQSISPQFATKRNYSFRSCRFSSCTALVVGYKDESLAGDQIRSKAYEVSPTQTAALVANRTRYERTEVLDVITQTRLWHNLHRCIPRQPMFHPRRALDSYIILW